MVIDLAEVVGFKLGTFSLGKMDQDAQSRLIEISI